MIAAIQGAAIGGGLGLALMAIQVRLAGVEVERGLRASGFHHGLGLTVTLPAIVGQQKALELLYSGRRIDGAEAHRIGLADYLVPMDKLRDKARELATEIAESGPLAVDRFAGRSGADSRTGSASPPITNWWSRTGWHDRGLEGGIGSTAERRPASSNGR